ERGLAADDEDQVARGARDTRLEQLHGRPHDLARLTLDQLDPGSRGLEVVEVLRVDRREAPGRERAAHERHRRGGGVRRVIPALERTRYCGGAQTVRTVFPLQRLHPNHRTSWTCEHWSFGQHAAPR